MTVTDRPPPAPGDLATLDHLILVVSDLDRAAETYARLLGRDASWRGSHPGLGTANVLFRLDRTYLELLAPTGEGPLAAKIEDHLRERGEGLFGLAFGCGDLDAARAALESRGMHPSPPADGEGRDERTGAVRRWRWSILPEEETNGIATIAIEHRSPPSALPAAPPRADLRATISGVDHVVVHTADADRAIVLYRDRLGLRLALDRTFPDWGMRLVFFRVGGITLELANPLSSSEVPPGDRLWGISWRAADAEATRARLAAERFDVTETRPGRRPATRVFTVRDSPHGIATLVLSPT
jgi:catechol 2,3-dioxygenase-like lactoylglutathione lyase family enzyme